MRRSSSISRTPNIRLALRGLRKLLHDPYDTAEGFRVIEALDPLIHHREMASMSKESSGLRLLRERPELLSALRARSVLEALPEGSLGREYRDFCAREGTEPDGFVKVGEAGSTPVDDAEVQYVAHRMRDSHDVWHVVCGYRSDMAGENAILAFNLAQTRSPGMLLLAVGGLMYSFMIGGQQGKTMRRMAVVGWRAGLRARPFAAAPWEEWLARPLAEVRAELGVSEVPEYEPAYVVPRA